jgi:hypothetical protein
MRPFIALGFTLIATPLAVAQPKEERRFGLRYTPELYIQASPKQTLAAVVRSFDKDRYDYLVAFLLEPGFVEDQLRASYPTYEKLAAEQVAKEGLDKKGFDPDYIRKRKRELAENGNFENLVRRVRKKLEDDPESVKEIRKIFREGTFQDGGETSVAKHADVKDRAIYFRRISDRWYLENKMFEE